MGCQNIGGSTPRRSKEWTEGGRRDATATLSQSSTEPQGKKKNEGRLGRRGRLARER